MKLLILLAFLTVPGFKLLAQEEDHRLFKGMYIQWGYNFDAYTKSNIHFKMSNGNNFTLHHASAHDANDLDAIAKEPVQISIPQYNYRFGFYLDKKGTQAIEINFDHAKYIVTDGQTVRVTGTIDGKHVDGDSTLDPNSFLHFEHTDGANWLHINYVRNATLFQNHARTRKLLTYVYKGGAGINIPRSDFTWRGDQLNNNFHVAGYNFSVEGGFRFYPLKRLFLEASGKTGYVRYVNALANTKLMKGNRVSHDFMFLEAITTLGFEFRL